MVQEYLLLDKSQKEKIEAYIPDGIDIRWYSIDSSERLYVQYSLEHDDKYSAKELSKIDRYIRDQFDVTVLRSGCAEYFNKKLYPKVNTFECKLRKLLYIASAINKNAIASENIDNLEAQDLGEVFTLLFVDEQYMKKVKTDINKTSVEHFSKAEIVALADSFDETVLWDKLPLKETVPTLRKHFQIVREYRNDVMHMHLIDWNRFCEIEKLFETIIRELDEAIEQMEVTEWKHYQKSNYNEILKTALLQIQADKFRKVADMNYEQMKNAAQIILDSNFMETLQVMKKNLADISKLLELTPDAGDNTEEDNNPDNS